MATDSDGPIFSRENVNGIEDHMMRLVRVIFYRLGLSLNDFGRRYVEYWRRARRPVETLNSQRNNIRRRILNERKLTFHTVHHILGDILRMDIRYFSVTVHSPEVGGLVTFDSNTVIGDEPPGTLAHETNPADELQRLYQEAIMQNDPEAIKTVARVALSLLMPRQGHELLNHPEIRAIRRPQIGTPPALPPSGVEWKL